MPRAAGSDDTLERLRAAIDELAAADAADLLAEARIEARARVRATLTDALAHSMLERLHEQLDEPAPAEPPAPERSTPPRAAVAPSMEPAEAGADPAWYVYGVVPAGAELDAAARGADPERPLTILSEGDLAAVASRVSLQEFDEARLREHLADLVWVEATARAHQAVLDRIHAQATVIPMRMCTVYRTEGGIREMLSREAGPLQEAIEQLDGRSEWAVKAFADIAASGGGTQADDASGAAYMERLRNEGERRERALATADEAAAQIHDRLSAVVTDARVIPLQRAEVSGHAGEMILNGVYLVAEDDAPALHEHVAALRSEFEEHGIELVLTGPWPAYNFIPATIGAAW